MVGMVDVMFATAEVHLRILADDEIGLDFANVPHQAPPQFPIGLQKTILLAHENHFLHAQDPRRRPLLLHAALHQFGNGDAEVVVALVAIGEHDVGEYSAPASVICLAVAPQQNSASSKWVMIARTVCKGFSGLLTYSDMDNEQLRLLKIV